MRTDDIEQQTFRLERLRSIAAGITETANSTFLGVIAIKYFEASQTVKGILLTNTSMGMLISPLILWLTAQRGWSAGKGIVIFSTIAALSCLLGLADSLVMFALGGIISYAAAASIIPLYISIYETNYRVETRGRLFVKNYFLRIVSNILFAYGAGLLLDAHLNWYPVIILAYALCFAVSAWCVSQMPMKELKAKGGRNPLTALRHVKEDKVFRWTLVSWMLLGFANLTMFPLRTEYLASPKYGIGLTAHEVAMYTAVIPNIARLAFTNIWGPLFDKVNFVKLRIILNAGFMLGFLSFFTGSKTVGLITGAILFGISNAGADVVWNLWVTKIATPDKTAEYMAVHSFLTGVRGVAAPIIAYQMTLHMPIWQIATGCAFLVVLASALLWKERGAFTAKDLPEELTPDVE